MAKKRKAPRNSEPSGPKEVDPKDARLTVRSYKDVANEQDEYFEDRDRIDFSDDDEPRSKRLRQQEKEDAFLEASDEEVFAEDDESDESAEEEEEEEKEAPARKQKARKPAEFSDDDMGGGDNEDDEGDEGWWGSSKKEYYDADTIENEADALAEEAEARRIQAKKLAKMEEADFAFDEGEWLNLKDQTGGDEDVVTEVLKEAEVTDDMGPEERYKVLQARYPEFDYLVDEFRELQPLLPTYQKEAEEKCAKSLEVVRFWVLGCYIASLASYFAILTSPARDGHGSTRTLSAAELRDHEVMEMLMSCREKWLKVKNLKTLKPSASDTGMLSPPEDDLEIPEVSASTRKRGKRSTKAEKKVTELLEAEKAKKAKAAQKSLADLSTLLKGSKSVAKTAKTSGAVEDDDHSDFGEEETLDARTAADKDRRKKSLKFYTSQIVQKANRRADAGRDAGGDLDIPYRERFRDRQMRLNAEAEKRGKKNKAGTELGGDDSDGEAEVAKQVRGDEDEYYDMVAQKASKRRDEKEARFEAIAAARKGERVVEQQELGPDGKRQISYQIQKNKGLMPSRRKEVRNPRVKKRMMFEAKQKKLRSVKATYKGGEGRGGYQGELSGIKTGLVKSVKL
ncbi:Sas10 C-terminal domain-containing protein [Apodospora peruviana]|uniref:Sas10 C-terminal domain-containing protein n=1 Tax=Apodospora peruviana TaxID=516989 RepID=A0AAE0ICA0_9PEZI|nr:Sas10 C-terminal domain-containing protein [Apodospora peruviana]